MSDREAKLEAALRALLGQVSNIEVLGEWSGLEINLKSQRTARAKIDAVVADARAALAAEPDPFTSGQPHDEWLKAKPEAAERAQWQQDAERYHKLRRDFSAMSVNIDGNHAWVYRRNYSLHGPTLDAALDAVK